MQIPVIVEPTQCGQFRAQPLYALEAVGEGQTSEAALANLREALEREFQKGKQIVFMDFPSEEYNPWLAMAGSLKDDPLYDEWRAAMEENRDQSDREAGIERD
ncbi:MAG TPA: hypothetical protein VFV87_22695 [Pirellulaceae bacterium]|nr:hypothetical protein [Pirellulaceae bacterium]